MRKVYIFVSIAVLSLALGHAQVSSIPGGGSGTGSGTVAGTTGAIAAFTGSTTVGDATAGTGISIAGGAISTDSAIIPYFATGAGAPSAAGVAGSTFYTDLTNDVLYFLRDTDTWAAVLKDPGSNGMVTRTAAGTTTARTITGTSNKITVTNGDGVSGAPTLTIADTLDLSGHTSTKPAKTGTSPPASCAQGELFVDTDATAASQLLVCTATNTWTAQGGGGSSTVRDSVWLGPYGQRDNTTNRQLWQMSTYAAPVGVGSAPYIITVGALPNDADTTVGYWWQLPHNWDSSGSFDIYVVWSVGSAVSTSWRAEVKTACFGSSDDVTGAPSFNTTSASSLANGGSSDRRMRSAFTNVSMTNCAAGEAMLISIMRDGDGTGGTDDMTQTVSFHGAEVVFTRTNP